MDKLKYEDVEAGHYKSIEEVWHTNGCISIFRWDYGNYCPRVLGIEGYEELWSDNPSITYKSECITLREAVDEINKFIEEHG